VGSTGTGEEEQEGCIPELPYYISNLIPTYTFVRVPTSFEEGR
jgi:hypothetical protein